MKAKIVSFINMKGGVGKTTLAINIGHKLASTGSKVLILDMDPQFNATQSLLLYKTRLSKCNNQMSFSEEDEESFEQERKSSEYYDDLSKNKQTILQIFENSNLCEENPNLTLEHKITDNLFLIPGDLKMSKEVSGDTANKVSAVMDHLEDKELINKYDYIFIDCPPTWSILTQSSLVASDFYVIPSKVDFYSSIGIKLLEEQIDKKILNDGMYKKCNKKLKELGIIFTLVHKAVKAEDDIKKSLKEQFDKINFFENDLPYMPSVPTRFVMIGEANKNSTYDQLSNALEKITNELVNKMSGGIE